jgi:hypothetical protein
MRRVPSPHPGDQPDLFQPCPETPEWAHLPVEVRQHSTPAGAIAAATPTRIARRGTRTGGVR